MIPGDTCTFVPKLPPWMDNKTLEVHREAIFTSLPTPIGAIHSYFGIYSCELACDNYPRSALIARPTCLDTVCQFSVILFDFTLVRLHIIKCHNCLRFMLAASVLWMTKFNRSLKCYHYLELAHLFSVSVVPFTLRSYILAKPSSTSLGKSLLTGWLGIYSLPPCLALSLLLPSDNDFPFSIIHQIPYLILKTYPLIVAHKSLNRALTSLEDQPSWHISTKSLPLV